MRMIGCNNGRYARNFLHSDCVINEKTVVLQKKDNEGFGFVLRGAKGREKDGPLVEFTPTPAFPALQYLESVDEGGVAWKAGLRTGDFLIEVNQDNVVKVGHKQVVNMIRHGGNHLIIKVVTVSRNLDPDDTARKKAPLPPRRAPSTALSMRSKSMTSELEDLGKHSHGKQKHLIQCLVLLNTFLQDKGPFTQVVFLHFVSAVIALYFGVFLVSRAMRAAFFLRQHQDLNKI
uniref:PDZ domain-containing protein n=1 Tax=Sinocyclocheilus rhinocerous TaxID=307959 RepID=A0A673H346_9TELE